MMEQYRIALTGNPNSGKTTLFNGLTGASQQTGNWPGVTVEKKEGILKSSGGDIRIIDLPGIYSFSPTGSEDERIACNYILENKPDLVVNVVDSTNLARNLYLTTQLVEMGAPFVIALNRIDLASKKNIEIDVEGLSAMLDCPVVDISAIDKKDVKAFKTFLAEKTGKVKVPENKITYPDRVEKLIEFYELSFAENEVLSMPERWAALRLVEGDLSVRKELESRGLIDGNDVDKRVTGLEKELGDSFDVVAADSRYGFINKVVTENTGQNERKKTITEIADRFILGRFSGMPIFLGIMYLVFWFAVTVGGSFIDFFDIAAGTIFVDGSTHLLGLLGSPPWLTTILAGGVGAGIQTVATFIPIIFSMFLMLTILEDSGYMARAAFVMDRVMRTIGLPGKSFVPMIVGFGCTVPAIMGTRTLDSKRDRLMTIFMAPFMSCGARLPVYALFGTVFFGAGSGAMVFSLYMAGIVLAILTGLLLKNTVFKGEPSYFIMELPEYNYPRPGMLLKNTWEKLRLFVVRSGKVIVIVVLLLSVLNTTGTDGTFGNEDTEKSVLSEIGRTITPIFEPMGIEKTNWPASVSVFTGIFAKEVIVGTLNSLYTQMNQSDVEGAAEGEDGSAKFSVVAGLKDAWNTVPENLAGVFGGLTDPLGLELISTASDGDAVAEELDVNKGIYSTLKEQFPGGALQVYAFLLFVLIYFPCVAALGAVVQEAGRLMGVVVMTYLTVLGWCVSTLFYQVALGHDVFWIAFALALLGAVYLAFRFMGQSSLLFSEEV